MRVLMTADAVGGIWQYADELRAALGAEVHLVAVGPHAPEGVRHVPGALEWQPDPWDDVARTTAALLAIADEVRPDVVHLNSFTSADADWKAPVVVVAHSDVISWHESVRRADAGPDWDEYRRRVTAGLRAADAVVAPTAAYARTVERIYGVPVTRIHNAVAAHERRTPERDGRPLVLAAGRLWDEAKGLDAIDGAAAMTRWRVEVAGEAEAVAAEHAVLLGPLERGELRARMEDAAVFAHPARYEPFGLVALEAAQAGCALVLGNIPTLRELWEGAALFVNPGDAESLASGLEVLEQDPTLREHLAAAARERAGGHTVEAMAARYETLYRELAGRAAGDGRFARAGTAAVTGVPA